MSKRNKDKGRLQPFVPLLIETLDCHAWRAMSMGARVLFAALKRRYGVNIHNNGRLFLSLRDAAEEIGSHKDQVARWYRELVHYGFIVMVTSGCLGVDGRGKAPHWRLTELGYMKDPPTRDFMHWKPGNFFVDEKQNPVPENRDTLSRKTRTPLSRKTRTGHRQVSRKTGTYGATWVSRKTRTYLGIPLVVPKTRSRLHP